MAPGCLATSRPPLKTAVVGMLLIWYRIARARFSSVLTFASRTLGSSSAAACSKNGAIILQGPHQGAQKSTTKGTSLRVSCRSKVWSVSVMGCPVKNGSLHFPQRGLSPSRALGIRFGDWQCEQTRT